MTEVNEIELRETLLAVPKSLQALSEPYVRLHAAERRAFDAEQALTLAERDNQRQAHLIALMLDELGGSLTISTATLSQFRTARSVHTETNNADHTFRVYISEVAS